MATFLQFKRCAMLLLAGLTGFGSHPAEAGLTESQFDVLATLFRVGTIYQQDLLREQWFSKGNLTPVLKHLEKAGLVDRHRLDGDHRFVKVRLTAAGRSLIGELVPRQARAICEFFSVLSAPEQAQLRASCHKLGALAVSRYRRLDAPKC